MPATPVTDVAAAPGQTIALWPEGVRPCRAVVQKIHLAILSCRNVVFIWHYVMDEGLTLEELSERAGVEPRTLRSWVSEGLLAPPFKPGRGARYPALNAEKALAVRALKDVAGLSLAEIGRRLLLATDDQIRAWAAILNPTATPSGTAREYLERVRAKVQEAPPAVAMSTGKNFSAARSEILPRLMYSRIPREHPASIARAGLPDLHARSDSDMAGIERVALQLANALDEPAPRRSRGTIWTRIPITPDIEISVRGELNPAERLLFEQVADQLRAALTGGNRND